MSKCRILVFGAGVIGSNLAADLFASGCDVTLLARGDWANCIEQKGLTIKSAFLPGKKTYRIPVIRGIIANDEFDVIFVVMRYSQLDATLETLNANISKISFSLGTISLPANFWKSCRRKMLCSHSTWQPDTVKQTG